MLFRILPVAGVLIMLLALGVSLRCEQFFPDLVATKSGDKIEGRITAESEQSVTMSIETPTGKTERAISKSDIAYIIRAPGETPSPPLEPPTPSSLSPDKKWAYVGGDEPKLFKAGTRDVGLDFSECNGGGCGYAAPLWAPDSKRLAFYHGQGREHETSLYQLRRDEWKALKSPGEEDEILGAAEQIVAAQLKKKGLPEKTILRELWWKVQPDRWVDSNTLIVYASMAERLESKDLGFGANFLFTLRFDDAGNWKIIKTHPMSAKEDDEFYQRHD